MKPNFRLARPARLLAVLFFTAGLPAGAHAQSPDATPDDAERASEGVQAVYPANELTPQIFYQLL